MARETSLSIEDENGELHEYTIWYNISKGHSGSYDTPPDATDLDIVRIEEDGIEIDNLDEDLMSRIEEHCIEEAEDDDNWFYDEDDE